MITSYAPHGKGHTFAQRSGSICCDVLDAWFEPSPLARTAFLESVSSIQVSPETDGGTLALAISDARGLNVRCVNLGAGSSEIIHRVLPQTCTVGRAVLVDPTYSEYGFVLDRAGFHVDRFALSPESNFLLDLESFAQFCRGAALVVLVNPNNPTGTVLSRQKVLQLREALSPETVLWVDEAYVDYAPQGTSVERDACIVDKLYVLKSLSKAYALSGLRAAYLVCSTERADAVRQGTPPWIVGTASGAASIAALSDEAYYHPYWRESMERARDLSLFLRDSGLTAWHGALNAVLVQCPKGVTAEAWADDLAQRGLIVRTPEGMGSVLANQFIRVGLVQERLMKNMRNVLVPA